MTARRSTCVAAEVPPEDSLNNSPLARNVSPTTVPVGAQLTRCPKYEIMDPSQNNTRHLSRRPHASLVQGSRGVISNGKENTVPFFDRVEAILRIDYGFEVIRRTKANTVRLPKS